MIAIKTAVIIALTLGTLCRPLWADEWATDRGSAYLMGSKTMNFGLALYPSGFYGAFDYGFHQAISAGIALGIIMYPDTYVPIIVRAAFHPFNLSVLQDKISIRDKLDVYGGFALGLKTGLTPPFTFSELIGARYFFSPNFGVFLEDCAGVGWVNLGVTIVM